MAQKDLFPDLPRVPDAKVHDALINYQSTMDEVERLIGDAVTFFEGGSSGEDQLNKIFRVVSRIRNLVAYCQIEARKLDKLARRTNIATIDKEGYRPDRG